MFKGLKVLKMIVKSPAVVKSLKFKHSLSAGVTKLNAVS